MPGDPDQGRRRGVPVGAEQSPVDPLHQRRRGPVQRLRSRSTGRLVTRPMVLHGPALLGVLELLHGAHAGPFEALALVWSARR